MTVLNEHMRHILATYHMAACLTERSTLPQGFFLTFYYLFSMKRAFFLYAVFSCAIVFLVWLLVPRSSISHFSAAILAGSSYSPSHALSVCLLPTLISLHGFKTRKFTLGGGMILASGFWCDATWRGNAVLLLRPHFLRSKERHRFCTYGGASCTWVEAATLILRLIFGGLP